MDIISIPQPFPPVQAACKAAKDDGPLYTDKEANYLYAFSALLVNTGTD
jgi:hypothetical protein